MSRYCRNTLFQYQYRTTLIHRQPALIKLIVFCAASISLSSRYQPFMLGYTFFLVLTCFAAQISSRTVYQNSRLLLCYTTVIFTLKITGNPIEGSTLLLAGKETALFMHTFALILFSASVFYETTSRTELLLLCEQSERHIRRKPAGSKQGIHTFSLTITLTLMCIPYIFENWAILSAAYTARCGKQKTYTAALHKTAVLIPALIENVLIYAVTAEKALRNRTHCGTDL